MEMKMKTTTDLTDIREEDLLALSGGGFAYDLARVIRYIVISGGGANSFNAILDWVATDAANEALNE